MIYINIDRVYNIIPEPISTVRITSTPCAIEWQAEKWTQLRMLPSTVPARTLFASVQVKHAQEAVGQGEGSGGVIVA